MPQIDLTSKFPYMTPVKSAPPLFRINGCGVGLYGNRDADAETGTYVTTLCISLLFIPLFCLHAYRVTRGMNKAWYFVGREPLSTMAKTWNFTFLAIVLAAIGGVSWNSYTSTPGYQAKRQMAEAQDLVNRGQLAQGARIYQSLAVAGAEQADNAALALKDLVDNKCQQAPIEEAAEAIVAAAKAGRRNTALPLAEIVDKGLKVIAEKGGTNPRAAIGVLDAIRPLAVNTRPIDDARLPLLRKWAATDPTNLEAISPLAALLEQQNHLDEAKGLLLPVKDKLGTGEGCVLGTILGREGDYDGAYALLWPYVKGRLDSLHVAEKAAENTMKTLWDREIGILRDDKGPPDFYDKYKAASQDGQHAMVQQYVNSRIKNDPQFLSSQEALERESAVVPVALELGIVMLNRAQAQTDLGARTKQLEDAEKVFLAISGIAGESDEYRIYLGQVYYWLGKQAEGRKLFDDLLAAKGRTFGALYGVATRLRALGAEPDARALLEEAYNKGANSDEQHQAASFRALCNKDLDDEIAWLSKADTLDPITKARLASARGQKAFEEGNEADAIRQYNIAIETYSAMPRNDASLNNTALAYLAVFRINGDRQTLEHGIDYLQQAVNLNPSDPVLLFNAAVTLNDAAVADIIGNEIDLRALHQTGNISPVGYLYNDRAGRDAIVQRVKDHPGIAHALSYLEKVMVLSPKNTRAYAAVYAIHQFTHNEAALCALDERLKSSNLDTSDEVASTKEYLSGVKDEQNKANILVMIKRSRDLADALRPKGGRTAAVAIDTLVQQIMYMDGFTDTADPEEILKLSEEAHGLAPSTTSNYGVITAHFFRACKEMSCADPAFAAFCKKYARSFGTIGLVALAASEPSSFQQKVLLHPDVQKGIAMLQEDGPRFPNSRSTYHWALLKNFAPNEAGKVAEIIRGTPRMLVEQLIEAQLNPANSTQALESYWLMQINGKPDAARDAFRKIAALGIPTPIEP